MSHSSGPMKLPKQFRTAQLTHKPGRHSIFLPASRVTSNQLFPPLYHIHKGEGERDLFHFGFKFKLTKLLQEYSTTKLLHTFCATISGQSQATVVVHPQMSHP